MAGDAVRPTEAANARKPGDEAAGKVKSAGTVSVDCAEGRAVGSVDAVSAYDDIEGDEAGRGDGNVGDRAGDGASTSGSVASGGCETGDGEYGGEGAVDSAASPTGGRGGAAPAAEGCPNPMSIKCLLITDPV